MAEDGVKPKLDRAYKRLDPAAINMLEKFIRRTCRDKVDKLWPFESGRAEGSSKFVPQEDQTKRDKEEGTFKSRKLKKKRKRSKDRQMLDAELNEEDERIMELNGGDVNNPEYDSPPPLPPPPACSMPPPPPPPPPIPPPPPQFPLAFEEDGELEEADFVIKPIPVSVKKKDKKNKITITRLVHPPQEFIDSKLASDSPALSSKAYRNVRKEMLNQAKPEEVGAARKVVKREESKPDFSEPDHNDELESLLNDLGGIVGKLKSSSEISEKPRRSRKKQEPSVKQELSLKERAEPPLEKPKPNRRIVVNYSNNEDQLSSIPLPPIGGSQLDARASRFQSNSHSHSSEFCQNESYSLKTEELAENDRGQSVDMEIDDNQYEPLQFVYEPMDEQDKQLIKSGPKESSRMEKIDSSDDEESLCVKRQELLNQLQRLKHARRHLQPEPEVEPEPEEYNDFSDRQWHGHTSTYEEEEQTNNYEHSAASYEQSNYQNHSNYPPTQNGSHVNSHYGTSHHGTSHLGTSHHGTSHLGTSHLGTSHLGTSHLGTSHHGKSHQLLDTPIPFDTSRPPPPLPQHIISQHNNDRPLRKRIEPPTSDAVIPPAFRGNTRQQAGHKKKEKEKKDYDSDVSRSSGGNPATIKKRVKQKLAKEKMKDHKRNESLAKSDVDLRKKPDPFASSFLNVNSVMASGRQANEVDLRRKLNLKRRSCSRTNEETRRKSPNPKYRRSEMFYSENNRGRKSGYRSSSPSSTSSRSSSRDSGSSFVASSPPSYPGHFGEKFFPFFTKKYIFSNHYPCNNLMIKGKNFTCTEQYYMYMKAVLFHDYEVAEDILASDDPKQMKTLGSKVNGFDQNLWDRESKRVMKRANWAKYAQNAELRMQLFETNGLTLVEANPSDYRWGVALSMKDKRVHDRSQWRGQNWLGNILTCIREKMIMMPKYAPEVKELQNRMRRRTM